MPKINQQNIQIFHIPKENDSNEVVQFIQKNYQILQSYLLVFDALDSTIKECLEKYELDYILPKKMKLRNASNPSFINEAESSKIESSKAESAKNNLDSAQSVKSKQDSTNLDSKQKAKDSTTKIFKELIRTGADINEDRDIVIFNRVNSAAHIKSTKNICIYGECEGSVKCDGEYMILPKNIKGKILFNGFTIMPNMLKYKLNLIIRNGGILEIKDILAI